MIIIKNILIFAIDMIVVLEKDHLKELFVDGKTSDKKLLPFVILLNLQTQYDIDVVNIAKRDKQEETVKVAIPVDDRILPLDLVKKFGWVCVC